MACVRPDHELGPREQAGHLFQPGVAGALDSKSMPPADYANLASASFAVVLGGPATFSSAGATADLKVTFSFVAYP